MCSFTTSSAYIKRWTIRPLRLSILEQARQGTGQAEKKETPNDLSGIR